MSGLELRNLTAGYGDADIVSGIDIDVAGGEIVTICGTNGAGKSTIVKAIMGMTPRCTGRVTFAGVDLLVRRQDERLKFGISYVPQAANVFPSLTVLENLHVMECVRDYRSRCEEMFAFFPALAQRGRVRAGALSGGERQQLAIARALMPQPKLMILDEPTAALSPAVAEQVFTLLAALPRMGAAALVVEQRARQSLEISGRGYILDAGRIVMQGRARDLLEDPNMTALYLGASPSEPACVAAAGDPELQFAVGRPS